MCDCSPNSNPLSCVTGLRYDHSVAQMLRYVIFSMKIDDFRRCSTIQGNGFVSCILYEPVLSHIKDASKITTISALSDTHRL